MGAGRYEEQNQNKRKEIRSKSIDLIMCWTNDQKNFKMFSHKSKKLQNWWK